MSHTDPHCPICNTAFETGDVKTVCPACKLVFHSECWKENKGCATYGCSQVNALNPPIRGVPPFHTGGNPFSAPYTSMNHPPNYGGVDWGIPNAQPALLQKIKFAFHGWWITWGITFFLALMLTVAGMSGSTSEEAVALVGVIALFFLLALVMWTIFGCILFYRLWRITDESVRNNVSPGFAAGAFFIPFYNLFWFPAGLYRLADNMDRTLALRGISHRCNMSTLGGWAGGMWLVLGFISNKVAVMLPLLYLVVPLMLLFYYLALIEGAAQILNHPHQRPL